MDSCTLYPPTRQFLSNEVIGSVIQRAWVPDGFIDGEGDESVELGIWSQRPTQYNQVRDSHSVHALIPAEAKRKRDQSDTLRSKNVAIDTSKRYCVTKEAITSDEHQRELRRLRQVRYRKKKDELMLKLKEDTVNLRKEVELLEERRRAMSVAVSTTNSIWDVALRYSQVFRFGVIEPAFDYKAYSEAVAPTSAQLDFLLSAMTEEITFNSKRGAEAIMQMWKCQTQWFKDFEHDLEKLEKSSAETLIGTTTTSFTITERTRAKVFPQ